MFIGVSASSSERSDPYPQRNKVIAVVPASGPTQYYKIENRVSASVSGTKSWDNGVMSLPNNWSSVAEIGLFF